MALINCLACGKPSEIVDKILDGHKFKYFKCVECGKYLVTDTVTTSAGFSFNCKLSDIQQENKDGFLPVFTARGFNGHYSISLSE